MLRLTEMQRQIAFWSLAGAALVVLLVAAIAILVAVDSPLLWLGICLGIILLIIVAEIVLLLMDKPERPQAHPAAPPAAQQRQPQDSDVEFEL